MMSYTKPTAKRRRFPRLLIIGGVIVVWLLLQFVWLDSYSWLRYQEWEKEYAQITAENVRLQSEIRQLQTLLETPPSDEMIEKIAREQYGMRREGETVYRVEE